MGQANEEDHDDWFGLNCPYQINYELLHSA
jgi:hypothetical protein